MHIAAKSPNRFGFIVFLGRVYASEQCDKSACYCFRGFRGPERELHIFEQGVILLFGSKIARASLFQASSDVGLRKHFDSYRCKRRVVVLTVAPDSLLICIP
eukprot:5947729-Amphidinium_carterae.1